MPVLPFPPTYYRGIEDVSVGNIEEASGPSSVVQNLGSGPGEKTAKSKIMHESCTIRGQVGEGPCVSTCLLAGKASKGGSLCTEQENYVDKGL